MEEQHSSRSESPAQEIIVVPLEYDDLIVAVRKQIEYYFSKENLQQDAFLTSHMDASMSVPISVVMKFSKMKALTQDEAIVTKALENSNISIVDGKIKASVKAGGRSTIILREIPSNAPEEEVRAIFSYDGCKPISSMRSDIGDTWFVTMESEEDAKDTLLDLRLKKRTFRGNSVKSRMKTETIVRSFFPMQQQVSPPVYPGMAFPFMGGPVPMGFGTPYGMMPNMGLPVPPAEVGAGVETTSPVVSTESDGSVIVTDDAAAVANGKTAAAGTVKPKAVVAGAASAGASKPSTVGRDAGNRDRKNSGSVAGGRSGSNGAATGTGDKRGDRLRNGQASSGRREGAGGAAGKPAASIEITGANFPPLNTDDSPIPVPGYKGSFLKYTFDEIVNIVKEIREAHLPDSIVPSEHPLSMALAANTDLLQRQRSLSIDETREQLRQGRPVQREAIISGAVDYGSMIYGDGYNTAPTADGVAKAVKAPGAPTHMMSPAQNQGKHHSHGQHSDSAKKSSGTWASLVRSNAAANNGTPAENAASGNWRSTKIDKPATAPAAVASTATAAATPSKDARGAGRSSATPSKSAAAGAEPSSAKKGEKKERGGEKKDVGERRRRGDSKGEHPKKEENKVVEKEVADLTAKVAAVTITEPVVVATATTVVAAVAVLATPAVVAEVPTAAVVAGATSPAASTASSWGSKPSFANILKQNEAAAEGTSPVPTVKKTVETKVQTGSSSPARREKKGGNDKKDKPVAAVAPVAAVKA